ncbi:MarR family transcriptional regulator [Lentzea sp. BCCO 10_0798]|uniref:MarR family transcriptional regulator n=1 Tax=Lentzea kristufekii TaxID=3095430 RepID=A0ABU4U0G7_9PSEU|nr:MarR family transcriptional regulator [Lentzea sp. BCCO 10_0798]MDX8053774.1 MarR family transcriptional regulator [Lentzea sp. BCCO 10_0798]
MSSKTRTRTANPATQPIGSARTLRSVPDQATAATDRTDAEDKLWEALHTSPNSTAADLAVAAKIGKSTAQKILAKWADDASVTRITGIAQGGRRAADLWAIANVDTTQNDPAPAEAPAAADQDLTGIADTEPDAPAVPVTDDGDDTTAAENNSTDPVDTQPVDTDPVDTESTVAPVEGTPDTVDDETGAVQAGLVVADTEPASAGCAATHDNQATTRGGADAAGEKTPRLPSGALRGMVEDFLGDHPGEEFGPTAIAKALGGKSSGAVSNALDKLADAGTAMKTNDKPRRFALASTQQAPAPAPTS